MTAVTPEVEEQSSTPQLQGPGAGPVPDNRYTPEFGVIVICDSEEEQARIYTNLRALGYKDAQIRVATI